MFYFFPFGLNVIIKKNADVPFMYLGVLQAFKFISSNVSHLSDVFRGSRSGTLVENRLSLKGDF